MGEQVYFQLERESLSRRTECDSVIRVEGVGAGPQRAFAGLVVGVGVGVGACVLCLKEEKKGEGEGVEEGGEI